MFDYLRQILPGGRAMAAAMRSTECMLASEQAQDESRRLLNPQLYHTLNPHCLGREYVVEAIVARRPRGRGYQVLVKWVGWDLDTGLSPCSH